MVSLIQQNYATAPISPTNAADQTLATQASKVLSSVNPASPDGQALSQLNNQVGQMFTEMEEGNDSAAADTAASASDAASNLADSSTALPIAGIAGAFAAILAWISSILNLQTDMAQQTTDIATWLTNIQNAENSQLNSDNAALQSINLSGSNASSQIAQAQGTFQQDQLKYQNYQNLPNAQLQADQNAVSDLSKSTTTDFSNLQSLVQIWQNAASNAR